MNYVYEYIHMFMGIYMILQIDPPYLKKKKD